MTTETKRALIDRSICNIFRLLTDIINHPGSYAEDQQVIIALRSQGRLCSLALEFTIDNERLTLNPISLNTLKKRLTASAPPNNFECLNQLRNHAQITLSRYGKEESRPPKRSLAALLDQIANLKSSISSLQAVNMVLLQVLEVNRRDLLTISNTANASLRQKRINDALSRMISILGLNPPPFSKLKTVSPTSPLKLASDYEANR